MNCLLLYYTGTYNTRYITGKVKLRLEEEGWNISTYEIDPLNNEPLDYTPYDIVGLGSPIYGFTAPYAFLRFIKAQQFPRGLRAFIYKNSGESYHANDASSKYILRKLHKDGVIVENEYHFMMPYNIHFPYEDVCIREMLEMDKKLLEILVYEVINRIPNWKPYKAWPRLVTAVVSRPQYIAGNINSFLCKVFESKCCGQLKERRMKWFKKRAFVFNKLHHTLTRNHHSIHSDTLAEVHEMRTRIEPHTIASPLQNGSQRVRRASLAISTSHMNRTIRAMWVSEMLIERKSIRQALLISTSPDVLKQRG